MTPTEIRTALERAVRTACALECAAGSYTPPDPRANLHTPGCVEARTALSALPGETAPYDTGAAASLADVAALVSRNPAQDMRDAGLLPSPKRAGDTGPAPPRDLVEVVREWQEARKPVGLSAPGVGVAETYQAAVKRMAAADEALAAFDLDATEDDETETCETCQQPITGQVVRSWDDVPLCEGCAEPDRDARADNLDGPAGGALVGQTAPTESTGTSLREELTEIIRWRFRTADGAPMNGPLILERAMEIADEIAPMIEEATGER